MKREKTETLVFLKRLRIFLLFQDNIGNQFCNRDTCLPESWKGDN